jgi:8-oxo-dGTP pyrophosphatase MutT (NUDIX family)
MDIMRGKYKPNEPDYIKRQLRGMTNNERYRLEHHEFEQIWHDLWGSDMESSQRYAHDRLISKQKLAELRAGVELPTGERYTLSDLLRQEPSVYQTPEWGFPKGRRDPHETDMQCAYRELQEETGILEEELLKAVNVAAFNEQFYGSNSIHYRHTYYLAQYVGSRSISFDALNPEMAREIGNLAWKNLDEALLLLRPENVEKRGILIQLASLLRNFSPIIRNEVIGLSLETGSENNENEQQEQYVFSVRIQKGLGSRMDRTNRFFGARQTHRRISDIRRPHQGQDAERLGGRDAEARTGGVPVSRHRRQHISLQTFTEEGVQGEPPVQDNERHVEK